MPRKKNKIPLWRQYGFENEAEFLKRYPNANKPKTKKSAKTAHSRLANGKSRGIN